MIYDLRNGKGAPLERYGGWHRPYRRSVDGVIAILSVLLIVTPAFAGPPFITDDPEIVHLHHWEFYTATINNITRGDSSGTLPHFEFNYGAFPDTYFHIITPFAYNDPRGSGNMTSGYGDTELGVKWRFIHETNSVPEAAVFPLAELPTGSEERGLGTGREQVFLPVWLQKSFGEWTTYGGGGSWSNPGDGNKDYWFTGWVLQRKITDKLTLGGELFHATSSADDVSERTGINLGGFYDFTEHHHLLFSVGRDIKGPNIFMSYLAFQLTY